MNARRSLRATAIASAALLAGLPVGTGPAARDLRLPARSTEPVQITAAYTCAFPSGTYDAEVTVSASFPATVAPGEPVQAEKLSVRTALPAAAAADLPDAGEADVDSVTSAATLSAGVTRGGDPVAAWEAEVTAPATPVVEGEPLVLEHRGQAEPVTLPDAGEVLFTPGALHLDVRGDAEAPGAGPETSPDSTPGPGAAGPASGGTESAPGGAAESPAAEPGTRAPAATCTPRDGQVPALAAVRVTAGPPPSATPGGRPPGPSGSASPEARGEADGAGPRAQESPAAPQEPVTVPVDGCPGMPPADGLDRGLLPEPPPGANVLESEGSPSCTFPVGYSNVKKQRGAMVLNDPQAAPRLSSLRIFVRSVSGPDGYIEANHVGAIDMPPATSTFLGFDFMPVTATVELTSLTPATIVTVVPRTGERLKATVGYQLALRVAEAKVNGTPLPVGSQCRTAEPIDVRLRGGSPHYDILQGGLLEGAIDIPAFTGCGAGEDLDPLFTAAISGPDNYLKLNQGPLCQKNPCEEVVLPELPER
ncbi:DUF6801 domain-containing protein [Streptomyces sp. TRM 70351]|uniref:DUF6801 domain-containing protein n=1 Tax=Streptomyces sp. TRM 70351 TaxID=3116552 RepID=UPI002E7ACCFD|nr:DUF6801 domain-containing protein [Streptomyces sp. TRM 70351]MEE1927041.1 DUF6801 domain-containing protein [Streptomyces sp. TRM 70351]